MIEKRGRKETRKKLKSLLWAFVILTIFAISLLILVKAENSESSSLSEWRMFGRYLNHTAYDGISFTIIPGLNYSTFKVGGPISWSSPAVFNGYVFIGSEDGSLYQLNASNISQYINNFTATGIYTSPAVVTIGSNSYVYFGSGASLPEILYQLNASNISQQLDISTASTYYSSPVVANGSVYFGGRSSGVYQVNASNISQQLASFSTDGIYATPAVANDYVYVAGGKLSTNNVFYQLNASNISIQIANYSIEDGWNERSSPVVWNGYVYFGTSRNTSGGTGGAVIQLNASNVSQKIATYNVAPSSISSSSPAIATIEGNTYLYIGASEPDRNLYQLNASDISQKIANYSTGASVASSPVIANGYVYIAGYDGYVYQLNASNVSKLVGKIYTGSIIASTLAYAEGYIYFGSWNRYVYQINASNLSMFVVNDTTPPIVYVNVPNSYTSYSGTFPISIHMNEYGYCEYSIDGGTTNHTLDTNDNLFFHGTSATVPDGNYIIYAYCNDTAGNRNDTATNSFTMYTATPPGGDIGEPVGTSTVHIPSIPTGTPTTATITNPTVEVNSITITTKQNVSGVSITVTEVSRARVADFEIGISTSTRQIYQALNISVSGLDNDQIANATVQFRVNKSWVDSQRRATEEDILLFRKNDRTGRWTALNTIYLSEDEDFYYYSAITPGFSTFVIFFGMYECEPGAVRCFEDQTQMCLGNATWLVTEKCRYGCENGVCVETPLQSKIFYTVIIAIVSAGILIAFYFVLMRVFGKKRR
jgi:PGF-pre-PGF domain-containing protein